MCKKTLLLSLFLFHAAHGMQIFQGTCRDGMKIIFEYAMWKDQKVEICESTVNTESMYDNFMGFEGETKKKEHTANQNGLWHTIKRNHHLQLVSKDFKCVFWNCFSSQERFSLQEKDAVISSLVRMWRKGSPVDFPNFGLMPLLLLDIAVNIRANLYPIFIGSIYTPHSDQKCNPQMVDAILNIAADTKIINNVDMSGFTPLWFAIAYDHLEIVRLLVAHPVTQVNQITGHNKAVSPLYWATYYHRIEMIKLLVARPDIDVNALDHYTGETPLFASVLIAWPSMDVFRSVIDLLIDAGADSTVKNKNGQTVFDINYQNVANQVEVLKQVLAMKK